MNKRRVLIAGCLATLSAIALARAAQGKRPLRVVPEVDLACYAGKWYEIARFPNRFQKRCAGEVTAQYRWQPTGKISVLNRCRLESGEQIEAEGVTRVAGKGQPNSILKVRFAPLSFPLFQRFGETIRSLRSRRITRMRWWATQPGNTFGFCRDRARWTMPYTINSSMRSAGFRRQPAAEDQQSGS